MIKKILITLIISAAFIGFNVSNVDAQTPINITWTNENVYGQYHRIRSYNNVIAPGTKVLSVFIPYNANIVLERGNVISQIRLKNGSTVIDTIEFWDYFNYDEVINGNFDFDLTSYTEVIDTFDIELTTSLDVPLSIGAITFMNQNSFYVELAVVNKLRIHYVTDYFNTVDEILFNTVVYEWQMINIPVLPTPPNALYTNFENWYYVDGTIFYPDAIDSSKIVDGVLNVYAEYVTIYSLIYMYNLTQFAAFAYIPGSTIPRFDLAIPTIAPYTDSFGRYVVCSNNVSYRTLEGTPFNFEPLSESAFQSGPYRIYITPECTYNSPPIGSITPNSNNPLYVLLNNFGWANDFGFTFFYFIMIVIVAMGLVLLNVGTLAIVISLFAITAIFLVLNFLPLFVGFILLTIYAVIIVMFFKGGLANE